MRSALDECHVSDYLLSITILVSFVPCSKLKSSHFRKLSLSFRSSCACACNAQGLFEAQEQTGVTIAKMDTSRDMLEEMVRVLFVFFARHSCSDLLSLYCVLSGCQSESAFNCLSSARSQWHEDGTWTC